MLPIGTEVFGNFKSKTAQNAVQVRQTHLPSAKAAPPS